MQDRNLQQAMHQHHPAIQTICVGYDKTCFVCSLHDDRRDWGDQGISKHARGSLTGRWVGCR